MTADIRLLRWHERDREEYERLASAIARVRDGAARTRGEITAEMPVGPEEPNDADRARVLLAQRRSRDQAAGDQAELFGEPGWDILLTLFIAFEEGRPCPDAEIVETARVRPLVMARWLRVLIDRGLIRAIDVQDGSAAHALTDRGMALVLRCVDGA